MSVVRSGARSSSPHDVFRGMFAAHYGSVHAYCSRRLGAVDAADAASDVFVVAWRRLRRIPNEPETLPWLYGVARNVVANHLRGRRRRERLGARVAAHAEPSTIEEPDAIVPVLAALRSSDREILLLAAWEGLTPAEIGETLGCSANAAAVRLHRARSRLSDAWNEIHGGHR